MAGLPRPVPACILSATQNGVACMAGTDMFSVQGKTAIVTGASYGLGVTFAEALATAGANVVLAARSEDKLKAVQANLGDSANRTLVVRCDVTNSNDVAAMVDAAEARFGRVDILVNNAGASMEAGMMPERVPAEAFAATISVNLLGAFACAQEVGKRMLADGKGGSIINIASIMGILGQQNGPVAYQASKAALINMTRQPRRFVGRPRCACERHRTRLVPERDDRRLVRRPRVPRALREPGPDEPHRRPGRTHRPAPVSGERCFQLRHRPDARRGWRALEHRRGQLHAGTVRPAGRGNP